MKTSMNFYAPMWLLILGLAFGLFSCDNTYDDELTNDDLFGSGSPRFAFAAVDEGFHNIITSKENSPYDLDYVHIVMHDGKRVEDLKYSYGGNIGLPHPANRGYVFESDFLGEITYYNKITPYDSKPFYLYWSQEEVDTLVWQGETRTFYANGEVCYIAQGSPYMIKKGGN